MTLALAILVISLLASYRRVPILFWSVAIALAALLTFSSPHSLTDTAVGLTALVAATFFAIRPLRMALVSHPLFRLLRRRGDRLTSHHRPEPWSTELMSGRPQWHLLLRRNSGRLQEYERAFLDGPVRGLCSQLGDGVPPDADTIWQQIAGSGILALALPRSLGGPGLSRRAQERALSMIASRSPLLASMLAEVAVDGAAVCIAEKGTQKQRESLLPPLVSGERLAVALRPAGFPDIADTAPAIARWVDEDSKTDRSLKVSWRACEIPALRPVDDLLIQAKMGTADNASTMIMCIPANTAGIAFQPGTAPYSRLCTGAEVSVSAQQVLGLSAPATNGANGEAAPLIRRAAARLACRLGYAKSLFGAATALVRIARSNGQPLTDSQERQRALVKAATDIYCINAVARFAADEPTVQSIDGDSIATAIATSLAERALPDPAAPGTTGSWQALSSAVHAPENARRIYRDGVIGTHPFWLKEADSLADADPRAGCDRFDRLLFRHTGFFLSNIVRATILGLTNAAVTHAPKVSRVSHCYRHLSRLAAVLAAITDITVLHYRCRLSHVSPVTERLAGAFTHLFTASCVLQRFHDDGEPVDDVPLLTIAVQVCCRRTSEDLAVALRILDIGLWGPLFRLAFFPWGRRYRGVDDETIAAAAASLLDDRPSRTRLLTCRYLPAEADSRISALEVAFRKLLAAQSGESAIHNAMGRIVTPDNARELAGRGVETGILTEDQARLVIEAQGAISAASVSLSKDP